MKAVTQAGGPNPTHPTLTQTNPTPHRLFLRGTATQVNQFIHSVAVWGHDTPAVHDQQDGSAEQHKEHFIRALLEGCCVALTSLCRKLQEGVGETGRPFCVWAVIAADLDL